MCGIVGVIANRPAAPIVLEALKRLEYRGYDSAGIASLESGHLDRRRATGKLLALTELLQAKPLSGNCAIGHTRWATHGRPTDLNAHPHRSGPVAVVHNGIIENYAELRTQLIQQGMGFESETDTEVIAVLCHAMMARGLAPEDAAAATLAKLTGAYAVCFLFENAPDLMVCARRGSPLAVGTKEGEMFVGSDAIALAPLTDRVIYFEDGDWAVLRPGQIVIHEAGGAIVERAEHLVALDSLVVDKGEHRHFMAKEIHEQPAILGRGLGEWISPDRTSVVSPAEGLAWENLSRLSIVACGTACLAGRIGALWLEQIARIGVECDIASEFRYREPPFLPGGATLVVSQSGETADTLAALRYAKSCGQKTIAMVNVTTSTIAREADVVLPIHAGAEIGVASTKAFTAQLMCFATLAMLAARRKGVISTAEEAEMITRLSSVPRLLVETLALKEQIAAIAQELSGAKSAIFLGRGLMCPMAAEGALKLKEITYIHAEAYAAGELKHGPIALIDEDMPVIALAPHDALFDKTASNLREVLARKGRIILLGDAESHAALGGEVWHSITLPPTDPLTAPFVYAAAVQMLAYHTAVARGTDVDQPRNLAKSVTVE
jgi:glutamine---fructose-6-phosphate transaminase (isomerizing)